VVEVDGYAFHASARQRSEDLRRDAELHRLGLLVLRFSFEQVVHRREWWLGVVRDVLGPR
jgi:very-short-patch-repair endonuclease